jgi:hypothetical protein
MDISEHTETLEIHPKNLHALPAICAVCIRIGFYANLPSETHHLFFDSDLKNPVNSTVVRRLSITLFAYEGTVSPSKTYNPHNDSRSQTSA